MAQQNNVQRASYYGAPTTIAAIRKGVLESQKHLCVRELAERFCLGVQERDYISEPLAILYGVSQNMAYRRDPRTVEYVRAPYLLADQILKGQKAQGDCDDMTALICALCMSLGCECRVLTLAFKNAYYKGERQYSHVCAQARDPKSGKWITLDPVAGPKTKEMLSRAVAGKTWIIG